MGRIHRLPEALANQIAAGEVVERPASVVKELVENALDAGASRIEIRLEDGGRRSLDVLDDGHGMSREDALLALERHTTSKLKEAAQLFDLHTFGFRGEALPSIASVSRFTLTSRQSTDIAAIRVVVEGGKVKSAEDAGAPPGTRIEVSDLFFNVPARLKFLKSRATELGHVLDWVTRLALVYPGVAFLVEEDKRVHLKADPTGDARERIASLLGRDLREALYPVAGQGADVKLSGFIAGPQRANSTAREIFLFVNGRFVRDRGMLHAIARAYEGVLPIGRSPACVLFLEIAPGKVDVNVHPQKLEVRFSDPRIVYDTVARSIGTVLSTSPWLARPATPQKTYTLRPVPPAETTASPTAPPVDTDRARRIAEAMNRFTARHVDEVPLRASDAVPMFPPRMVVEQLPTQPPAKALRFAELRYLGQVHRTYLVCESPEGMLLLDQHAAHERVLYERYRLARSGNAPRGQPFLVPLMLELSPADASLVQAAREELENLGFELEPFGGTTWSVKAAPPELANAPTGQIIRELAQELRQAERASASRVLEDQLLARMACHTAVRAGHPLGPEEVSALLESLDGTPFHAQCPHGRPVVVRFETGRLQEMFGRTYEGTPRAAVLDRFAR